MSILAQTFLVPLNILEPTAKCRRVECRHTNWIDPTLGNAPQYNRGTGSEQSTFKKGYRCKRTHFTIGF